MSSKLVFKVPCPKNARAPPCEPQIFGGFKWNLYIRKFRNGGKIYSDGTIIPTYQHKLYLECTPVDEDLTDWKCTTQCQIIFDESIYKETFNPVPNVLKTLRQNQLLPYKSLTFSVHNNCQYVDDFFLEELYTGGCWDSGNVYAICGLFGCVCFQCFHIFEVTFKNVVINQPSLV
uniref:Uncharacterized protein n=1 Tax=Cacopsylla melanoneura TaxID=428564 RepID=A0A8D8YHT5_9HEMI